MFWLLFGSEYLAPKAVVAKKWLYSNEQAEKDHINYVSVKGNQNLFFP